MAVRSKTGLIFSLHNTAKSTKKYYYCKGIPVKLVAEKKTPRL